ncbi:MAG: dihydroorotate dehydrogenase B catalytic subunit [Thermoplasmatales archaeon B_DKE]|nr:MAG: dihydroorotate dehydrogenase B catalytic subunit [Thermoplasmatales archaeon B_DKE]
MNKLKTAVSGIELDTPFMLASGILDENGYTMKRVLQEGAAAVVTKSIGSSERSGYRPPVIVEMDGKSMINAIGLANPGIENFREEIAIALEAGKPVIGSVFGSDTGEFVNLSKKMEEFGVTAVELNLSCPHVKGFGQEVGSDPDLVSDIVSEVKRSVRIPVFAKLSPNVSDMIEIAKAADKADAYVLINTVKAMAIDIYSRMPVLSNAYGGLSGPSIKPVGVRYVYEVKKETGKEIIGVGGIRTGEDALEYIMAGASCVQVGTAVYSDGRQIFSKLAAQVGAIMDAEKIGSVRDIIGVAIRN